MRDDIHRRLSLRRPWKRALKACLRPAEAPERAARVEQALRAELRGDLRRAVVADAARGLAASQGALFPEEAFHVTMTPLTPWEAGFQRECAALTTIRLPAAEAVAQALERTAEERMRAQGREIRGQLSAAYPRDSYELTQRFDAAADAVDVGAVVRGYLAGESSRPPRPTFDLEADLRGHP